MNFETKLWKRSARSWATTIPHVCLLNLDLENNKYKVIWKWSVKAGNLTVEFEEA
jgi:hypothetical protein